MVKTHLLELLFIYKKNFLILTLVLLTFHAEAQTPIVGDSVQIAVAPEYLDVRKSHLTWFGENHRELWATPVKMRIFRLDQERGGMKILKRGGGQQTRSLRLEDSLGKQWVLRTVDKDPEFALPENLRETVAKIIVQDQIAASHPFGALAIPPLAASLGIPHAHPEIVYLPDDPALGEYQEDFGDQVYLYEEREPLYAEDTDNTMKVLEKLQRTNKHRYDQDLLLRARLLDIVVGDWDRHQDQWRWIQTEDEVGDFYEPVPRDRDQVFFVNEGIIPKIGSRKWIMPKFQGFTPEIRDIEGFNFNARHFDRRFLHSMDAQDWEREIATVQEALTDELIEEAIGRMPANIVELSGAETITILKSRRDNLHSDAMQYYQFISEAVDIPLSDKREFIDLTYQAGGSIHVVVQDRTKDGSKGRLLYERVFDPEVTNEIRVYGMGARDAFTIYGTHKSSIRVRLIGGTGDDTFIVPQGFANRRKLLIYDRADKDNIFPDRSLARTKTAADSSINRYNPTAFQYDIFMPQVTAGYNLDDGVLLGAGFSYTTHGFRKEPFAARHKLMIGHALATDASFFRYSGDFTQLVGKYDLGINIDGKAPNNTSNFFGRGNETPFDQSGNRSIRKYRTRYDLITAEVHLRQKLSPTLGISFGLVGSYYNNKLEDNPDRFISTYAVEHPGENVFATKYFGGLGAELELDTRSDDLLPQRGIHWNTHLKGMTQLDTGDGEYFQAVTAFSHYFSPMLNFTVANRIGGGTSIGNPDFYQLLYLGGNENLRGFRNYRFAGESILYHNLELRLKLFDFTSYLFPGSVGMIGFNDLGRVWADGEHLKKIHHGFGGGFYLIPAKMVLLHGVVGFSSEEILPHVSIGFRF